VTPLNHPIYLEAVHRFQELLERARQLPVKEPTAVALATVDASGDPSVRMVLLRGMDERGFAFYTNGQSLKGRHLLDNPRAALCFYWEPLEEQVRVEGPVAHVESDEADAYWDSRARASQIGAWASLQSRPLESREVLIERVERYTREFEGRSVPRPPHWSGYRLTPRRIEFWKSQPSRLHQRLVYEADGSAWSKQLLYP
jgi:pyridoxamine 5'-phosphate oxidase